MSDARDDWGLRGIALTVALVATLGLAYFLDGSRTVHDWLSPPILVTLGAAAASSLALSMIQMIGSVAGRGLPLPGARYAIELRSALSLAPGISLAVYEGQQMSTESAIHCALATVATLWFLRAIPRWGGPGLVAPGAAIGVIALFIEWPFAGLSAALAFILLLVAVSELDLRPSRLALLGITPWAPSDLAAIPVAVVGGAALLLRGNEWGAPLVGLTGMAIALAETGALVYLEGRLRAAEAHAASRSG